MCFCLCVLKDLANRWTDMVLNYYEDSHRSWESLLWGRVPPPFQDKSSVEKNTLLPPPPKKKKIKIESDKLTSTSQPPIPLKFQFSL